jgi:hypothetical protein
MMRQVFALLLAAAPPVLADPPAPAEPADGPALAELLRNAVPEDTNTVQGTLIIKAAGQTRNVPVVCRVVLHDDHWESVYDVAATANSSAEQLRVIHRANAPNQYLCARAAAPLAPLPNLAPITPAEAAATPLGGSDFSAADLGLDFLHWPQQEKMHWERRLDRPSYVLESRDPAAASIMRVKSYIDKESNAPLAAEGYDASNHLVKEFTLSGSSFKKVKGHWVLENMKIIDKKKKSQTELKFDILDK